jgi:hypothetical protein
MNVPVSGLAGLPHLYDHPVHDPTLLAARKDGLDYKTEAGLLLPTPSKHSALQVNTKVNVHHQPDSVRTTVTATATWTTTLPTNAEVPLQDGSTPSPDSVPCGFLSAHARLSQEAVEQHSQRMSQTLGSYDGPGLNDSLLRHSRSNSSSSVVPSDCEPMTESVSQSD